MNNLYQNSFNNGNKFSNLQKGNFGPTKRIPKKNNFNNNLSSINPINRRYNNTNRVNQKPSNNFRTKPNINNKRNLGRNNNNNSLPRKINIQQHRQNILRQQSRLQNRKYTLQEQTRALQTISKDNDHKTEELMREYELIYKIPLILFMFDIISSMRILSKIENKNIDTLLPLLPCNGGIFNNLWRLKQSKNNLQHFLAQNNIVLKNEIKTLLNYSQKQYIKYFQEIPLPKYIKFKVNGIWETDVKLIRSFNKYLNQLITDEKGAYDKNDPKFHQSRCEYHLRIWSNGLKLNNENTIQKEEKINTADNDSSDDDEDPDDPYGNYQPIKTDIDDEFYPSIDDNNINIQQVIKQNEKLLKIQCFDRKIYKTQDDNEYNQTTQDRSRDNDEKYHGKVHDDSTDWIPIDIDYESIDDFVERVCEQAAIPELGDAVMILIDTRNDPNIKVYIWRKQIILNDNIRNNVNIGNARIHYKKQKYFNLKYNNNIINVGQYIGLSTCILDGYMHQYWTVFNRDIRFEPTHARKLWPYYYENQTLFEVATNFDDEYAEKDEQKQDKYRAIYGNELINKLNDEKSEFDFKQICKIEKHAKKKVNDDGKPFITEYRPMKYHKTKAHIIHDLKRSLQMRFIPHPQHQPWLPKIPPPVMPTILRPMISNNSNHFQSTMTIPPSVQSSSHVASNQTKHPQKYVRFQQALNQPMSSQKMYQTPAPSNAFSIANSETTVPYSTANTETTGLFSTANTEMTGFSVANSETTVRASMANSDAFQSVTNPRTQKHKMNNNNAMSSIDVIELENHYKSMMQNKEEGSRKEIQSLENELKVKEGELMDKDNLIAENEENLKLEREEVDELNKKLKEVTNEKNVELDELREQLQLLTEQKTQEIDELKHDDNDMVLPITPIPDDRVVPYTVLDANVITFTPKKNAKTKVNHKRHGKPQYFPPHRYRARGRIHMMKRFTIERLPSLIKETFANLHDYMDKLAAINECVAMFGENLSAFGVINYRFHDKITNEELYCVIKRQDEKKNRNYQFKMVRKLFTAKELENGYTIKRAQLPKSLIFHTDFVSNERENVKTILKKNTKNTTIAMIRKTKWQNVPIFKRVNNIDRRTQSVGKNTFIKKCTSYFKNTLNDINLIPILMFDDHNTNWIEYVWIVQVDIDINIGISLVYDDKQPNKIKVNGIHLDKEYLLLQHQLLSWQHDCHCLDNFSSCIHDYHIGNPDDLLNQNKNFQKQIDELQQIKQKFEHFQKDYFAGIVDKQRLQAQNSVLQSSVDELIKCNKDNNINNTAYQHKIYQLESELTHLRELHNTVYQHKIYQLESEVIYLRELHNINVGNFISYPTTQIERHGYANNIERVPLVKMRTAQIASNGHGNNIEVGNEILHSQFSESALNMMFIEELSLDQNEFNDDQYIRYNSCFEDAILNQQTVSDIQQIIDEGMPNIISIFDPIIVNETNVTTQPNNTKQTYYANSAPNQPQNIMYCLAGGDQESKSQNSNSNQSNDNNSQKSNKSNDNAKEQAGDNANNMSGSGGGNGGRDGNGRRDKNNDDGKKQNNDKDDDEDDNEDDDKNNNKDEYDQENTEEKRDEESDATHNKLIKPKLNPMATKFTPQIRHSSLIAINEQTILPLAIQSAPNIYTCSNQMKKKIMISNNHAPQVMIRNNKHYMQMINTKTRNKNHYENENKYKNGDKYKNKKQYKQKNGRKKLTSKQRQKLKLQRMFIRKNNKPDFHPIEAFSQNIYISNKLKKHIESKVTIQKSVSDIRNFMNGVFEIHYQARSDLQRLDFGFSDKQTKQTLYCSVNSQSKQNTYQYKLNNYLEMSESIDRFEYIGDRCFTQKKIIDALNTKNVLENCDWDGVPIILKKNDQCRMTLTITKEQLYMCAKHSKANQSNLIPIAAYNQTKINFAWIIKICIEKRTSSHIALSLEYEQQNGDTTINAIYLDKEDLLMRHYLADPPHMNECKCLDEFESIIDDINIGNCDIFFIKMKHYESKCKNKKISISENESDDCRNEISMNSPSISTASQSCYYTPTPTSPSTALLSVSSDQQIMYQNSKLQNGNDLLQQSMCFSLNQTTSNLQQHNAPNTPYNVNNNNYDSLK